jgi:hypothetical protein
MKVRRFEVISGLVFAAMGGALLLQGDLLIGAVIVAFSYGWATGCFTETLQEEQGAK